MTNAAVRPGRWAVGGVVRRDLLLHPRHLRAVFLYYSPSLLHHSKPTYVSSPYLVTSSSFGRKPTLTLRRTYPRHLRNILRAHYVSFTTLRYYYYFFRHKNADVRKKTTCILRYSFFLRNMRYITLRDYLRARFITPTRTLHTRTHFFLPPLCMA